MDISFFKVYKTNKRIKINNKKIKVERKWKKG